MNIRVDESHFFITFASVMFWYDSVGILELIIKGAIIGIIASAGMGPVGVLCIQRTLNKGRWYGFVTGVGAAISDFIYALIVGLSNYAFGSQLFTIFAEIFRKYENQTRNR